MIPTIETIVEDLLAGTITKQQAIAWLHMHADGTANELHHLYAAAALQGITANPEFFGALFQQQPANAAEFAQECAAAMLTARGAT